MAEVLDRSKYNIRNENEFCEAERELLKAMDVNEAFLYKIIKNY
jgi:hypothetical protein